ncbi:MAG: TetR/AcrR family transcriptional regulator [Microbacteriaceae bacterium]|jgi:AcrR family transcriptional regulator
MPKTAMHPTREKLVLTMVEMLDGPDPEHVTVEDVLSRSGVSRGSLYHHFEDFEELYETGLAYRITQWVTDSAEAIENIFLNASSSHDIREGVRAITAATQGANRRLNRLERARAFGLAGFNPRFQAVLGVEQARMTEVFRSLIERAKERGWVKPSVDPMAMAVFIQAYTLGRVVDDISPDKVDPEKWTELIDDVVVQILFDNSLDS